MLLRFYFVGQIGQIASVTINDPSREVLESPITWAITNENNLFDTNIVS